MFGMTSSKARLWMAVALAALSGSACITTSGDRLGDINPPQATYVPQVENTVTKEFRFDLEGGKLITSNLAGRTISEEILKRWRKRGWIQGSSYVELSNFSSAADYTIELSGSQAGSGPVALQFISGLTLFVIPYYVGTTYNLHFSLQERVSGKKFEARVTDDFTTVVSWLLLPVSPFLQGGRGRTYDRLADHLYQQLYDQGAFRVAPVAAPTVVPATARPPAPATNRNAEPATDPPRRAIEDRLRELERLRSAGLITPEEFETRRKAVLDEL